jgi:hypothetical protein
MMVNVDGVDVQREREKDRELLENCLKAFDALKVDAAACRKVLARFGRKVEAYAGSGQYVLARHMADAIREHLGLEPKP